MSYRNFPIFIYLLLYAANLTAQETPNFLLIVSDDQRYDQIDPYMPNVRNRIFDEGLEFTNAYITTPECCPARAGIMTGLYAHINGVRRNEHTLRKKTIYQKLKDTHFTGLIGKYLNTSDGEQRPEFDYWAAFKGKGSPFFGPRINHQGTWITYTGKHITPLFGDFAIEFIELAKTQSKPFLLAINYNAPHLPAVPETEDLGKFLDAFPQYPSFLVEATDKPTWYKKRKKNLKKQSFVDFIVNEDYPKRLQTIVGLDRSIGRVLDKLESEGLMENTIVFFISDNGYLFGEHGLYKKSSVYEESIKVPFGVRWDGGDLNKRKCNSLVANIDITPTIKELSNTKWRRKFSGKSLRPLFGVDTELRKNLFFQNWRRNRFRGAFIAIRSGNLILIKNTPVVRKFDWELYDLEQDPFQLKNVFYKKIYRKIRKNLKRKLERFEVKSTRQVILHRQRDREEKKI